MIFFIFLITKIFCINTRNVYLPPLIFKRFYKIQTEDFKILLPDKKIYLEEKQIYSENLTSHVALSDSAKVYLLKSLFSNISCQESNAYGGAFFYNNNKGYIEIDECAIDLCYSASSSGAFYIDCSSYNIKTTCITRCRAQNTTMGFTISGESLHYGQEKIDPLKPHHIYALAVSRVGPEDYTHESSLYIILRTICNISQSNFSYSKPVLSDGTLAFENMIKVGIYFSAFHCNQGPGMIVLYQSQPKSRIKDCSFFDNDAGSNAKFFSLTMENKVKIKHCVFKHNNFQKFIYLENCNEIAFFNCHMDFPYSKKYFQDSITQTLNVFEANNLRPIILDSAVNIEKCIPNIEDLLKQESNDKNQNEEDDIMMQDQEEPRVQEDNDQQEQQKINNINSIPSKSTQKGDLENESQYKDLYKIPEIVWCSFFCRLCQYSLLFVVFASFPVFFMLLKEKIRAIRKRQRRISIFH